MKIGLHGTHSTGKTTTKNKFIEKHPKFHQVTEIARKSPYKINEGTDYLSQRWILHEQIKAELLNYPYDQISDRTTMDNCAYTELQFRKGKIEYSQYQELVTIAEAWLDTYDYVFYFPIEFPLEKDGIRSDNLKFQKDIDDIIKDNLKGRTFYSLTGTVEDRLKQIEKVVFRW
jgi:hypothetical protein